MIFNIRMNTLCRGKSWILLLLLLQAGAGAAVELLLPMEELRLLAARGDAQAQFSLGTALEYGEGVEKSPEEARDWYCRAAAQGQVDAWHSLGWMYVNGRGVPRNDDIARYWLEKAAASGDEQAARVLEMIGGGQARENGCSHVATLPWLPEQCGEPGCRAIVSLVEKLSREYGLDANLVLSVIRVESGFNIRAQSLKGASGLMQLIPATAVRFGVKDIWDVEQNIRGGMAYLRWLLAYFKGDLAKALAGYNAGEQRVLQYRGVPPFRETRNYVRQIIEDYGRSYHRYDVSWLDSWAASVPGLFVGQETWLPVSPYGG
ncbi:transglycosylase SLT domain-containing protein [Thiolapillus sp.]